MRYTIDEIYSKKNKKEKNRKIVRTIVYMLVIPLFIYNMVILLQVFSSGNEMPSFLGYKTFVIISGSMKPNLDINDIVVVKEVEQSELEKGDIVSFREGNSIVTHRILNILTEDGIKYITKGDANSSEDVNKLEYKNIEGRYAFKIPKLGAIVIFMQNKVGIVTAVLFIYFLYIINRRKEEKIIKRKEKRKIYEELTEDNK